MNRQRALGEPLQVPRWNRNHRLLDWPGCSIELCCACGWSTIYPCKLMAARHGNRTFGAGGPEPDWSLPLRAY